MQLAHVLRVRLRMDQCVAMGKGRVAVMDFDNDSDGDGCRCQLRLLTTPVPLYFVVADLKAAKDTVAILRDLNACFPEPQSEAQVRKWCMLCYAMLLFIIVIRCHICRCLLFLTNVSSGCIPSSSCKHSGLCSNITTIICPCQSEPLPPSNKVILNIYLLIFGFLQPHPHFPYHVDYALVL